MSIQVIFLSEKETIKDVMGVSKEPTVKEVYDFIIDVATSYGDFSDKHIKSKLKMGQPYKGKLEDLFHPDLLKEIKQEKELFKDILDSLKVAVDYYNKKVQK